jgi:hypothetical protein
MAFISNPYQLKDIPYLWVERDPMNQENLEVCPDMEFSGILLPHYKPKMSCPHKKRMDYCVECGGKQMCTHKMVKANCAICDGSQLCHHKQIWNRCPECKTTYACPHNRHKMHCKKCKQAKQRK